ncbi:hypothetical protein A3K64_03950 [Candidatus Micrarchaeota archaeon RBG_16_36_9]|nr:MAG: hypothetical protein A3K64_03950 [Candidatus Micrarchaeota archaeon RBG_16_36_9]
MMTVKQFLKPDWRKIVLFVILSSIFSYLYLYCVMTVCEPSIIFLFFITSLLYDYLIMPVFLYFWQIGLFIIIFITLFYWYFLSCLIVWIYNKVKKKK